VAREESLGLMLGQELPVLSPASATRSAPVTFSLLHEETFAKEGKQNNMPHTLNEDPNKKMFRVTGVQKLKSS
jgi:hypothetical protein